MMVLWITMMVAVRQDLHQFQPSTHMYPTKTTTIHKQPEKYRIKKPALTYSSPYGNQANTFPVLEQRGWHKGMPAAGPAGQHGWGRMGHSPSKGSHHRAQQPAHRARAARAHRFTPAALLKATPQFYYTDRNLVFT